MAQEHRIGAADLHGLARVHREKRWTAIMDSVLALVVVLWAASRLVDGLLPDGVGAPLPVVAGLLVVHRVLTAVERRRRARSGADVRRAAVRRVEPAVSRETTAA